MRWCGMMTACAVALGSLGGCIAADDLQTFDGSRVCLLQMEPLMEGEDVAVITTDQGEIRMRFFPSEAPLAVQNFIELARQGYFDGRALLPPEGLLAGEPSALISGSEQDDGAGGVSVVNGGKPFKKELSANLWHFPGAVSVLGDRSERGDSRFFITGSRPVPVSLLEELAQAQYPQTVVDTFRTLGGSPEFSLDYPVFAQVMDGQAVVDALIKRLEQGEQNLRITSVRIVVYEGTDAEE